ncbi:hypothetical protein [Microbulbifer sp. PSTR4-B]|uniref:hypothetical protein n=1 Tax=Microbulbifer sp. PSTR4-B TaxID=3243396 RepID=UPI004039054E
MPIARTLSVNRLEIQDDISESCIDGVVNDLKVKVIQTCGPITTESWKLLNDLLIPKRPDIEIRIYGHYSKVCDLSTLAYIPSVETLSIDCLREVSDLENITHLKALKSLSVGVYNLDNFDFLESLPQSMEALFLGATKSKKPKLDGLSKLPYLKELYIEGQNKNIEIVGELEFLEKLTLRSVSPKDISFLRKLSKLWSLDIKLGGIKDLSAIEGLGNLKYLELWQIKGLSDISVISTLTGLQYLFLQSLRNVDEFPDLSNLTKLRRIYLETMKGLEDLDGLFKAPALEEFIHVCAQNMAPDQYDQLLELKSLKKALFGFGSDKKNKQMKSKMKQKGIEEYSHERFLFN